MIKEYCDLCGVTLEAVYQNFSGRSITGSYQNVQFSIRATVGDVWNRGELCRECFYTAITEGLKLPVEGHDS